VTSLKKFWFESNDRRIQLPTALVLVGLSSIVASCRPEPRTSYLKGNTMGTFYSVQLVNSAQLDLSLQDDLEAYLDDFENQLSNWRPDSWVNRFNALPAHEPFPIPDHAFHVITLSLELAKRSDGALDLTASPLIDLWGFGPNRSETVPPPAAVNATLDDVGYRLLEFDPGSRLLTKLAPNVELNCSAVAKGYAVDLVAHFLDEKGIQNFVINIGGEIFARGRNETQQPWKIAVATATRERAAHTPPQIFALRDRAIATSGHTHRGFEQEGQLYSHIIDPRTGYPVAAHSAAATVIADSCALADGLATLALILTPSKMAALLASYPGAELHLTAWEKN